MTNNCTTPSSTSFKLERETIRKSVRIARQQLSKEAQLEAAQQLKINFLQLDVLQKNMKVAIYLSQDGELDTSVLINALWEREISVYLPVIHPFNKRTLIFQSYEKNSPMTRNRYGILEPILNCHQICPLVQLDYLLMPLVAFDMQGNRLGMGGGYYDRTLQNYESRNLLSPKLIGLAHTCQKVRQLPVATWDVPLSAIITPEQVYQW